MRFKIFTEDAKADSFYNALNSRLKDINIINRSFKIDADHLPGSSLCNSKQNKAIKAASTNYHKILIIVDADGTNNKEKKKEMVEKHIEEGLDCTIKIIILDYELEEWICKSLSINYSNKPYKDLDNYCRSRGNKRGYKKSEIYKFANKIDIESLKNISDYSFQEYIEFFTNIN